MYSSYENHSIKLSTIIAICSSFSKSGTFTLDNLSLYSKEGVKSGQGEALGEESSFSFMPPPML
jgi:hypothetical protein